MKIEIEKPVIPRFVADWVEKERTSSPIHKSFPRAVDLVNNDNDWRNWANEVGGSWSRILATAWVKGYGIEQEPLYYAKIKGHALVYTGYSTKYWILDYNKKLFIDELPNWGVDATGEYADIARLPIKEWNELGINEGNADFEKVEG